MIWTALGVVITAAALLFIRDLLRFMWRGGREQ
jgi:hypothetical protein